MKKLTVVLLIFSIMMVMTSCSSQSLESSETPDAGSLGQVSNTDGNTDISGGKILIAYFAEAENSEVDVVTSPSIVTINGKTTGRMRALAEMIQDKTGGELFSIKTSVKYPAEIDALIDFAAEEKENNARPELISKIDNLDDYDTVFIGYPNWWYDMPMVMYSFFEEYDFANKTIVPFNSHNGSRFSSTIETIAELEPKANVIEDGFTVNESDVADCSDDLNAWLSGLGF